MSAFVALFIILLCNDYSFNKNVPFESIKPYHSRIENYPWIGLLKVKLGSAESMTGIVLIADRVAIANANDISKVDKKTIRESGKAIFFETKFPRNCNVSNYLLHPEFETDTLNTIAIVYLDCDREFKPISWPTSKNTWKKIYVVGFTDQNKVLEQMMHQMVLIDSSSCREFYRKEEINFKHLWPCNFLCAKVALTKSQCIFDAGMALVANYEETPTLIGLSIYGPGCSLPSRYIEFLPYIPWIKSHIQISNANLTRRSDLRNNDVIAIDPGSDIVSDSHFIADDFYVTKLNDTTMMMEAANANIREVVHGDCLNNQGVMMYREAGLIRAKGHGTGVFALSLYDLFYNKITCVMVSVKCKKRSLTKFWYEKGFQKDDFSDLIKVVPFPKRGKPVPPKILFLTDFYHRYDKINTANILFKFEFENEAAINVDFYGTLGTITP